MRILIADDHAAIRIGLKHILITEYGNSLQFTEAVSAEETIRITAEGKWDLIILDINLPGRNGLDVLRQFKNAGNKTPVLVFTFHQDEQFAVRAFKAGADGFLTKGASDTEIIKAIRQVLGGRKYLPLSVAEFMASQLEGQQYAMPHERLSDREYQTLIMIGSGKAVSQIAKELSLGVPTISTYRARILEKMNMKTNADLTRYVIENKLA